MTQRTKAFFLVLALLASTAITMTGTWLWLNPAPPETQVWINGQVLTLDSNNRIANSIAIKGDHIVAVGDAAIVSTMIADGAAIVDLQGQTVLPGFVEAHGHFPGAGLSTVSADLNSPPIGDIRTVAQALARLRQLDTEQPGNDWLIGMGYDDTTIAERRHFTRYDLDQVSTERPIYVMHISGHMGVANSLGLDRLGISSPSADPEGGEIKRDPASGEPTGLLLETAHTPVALEVLKLPLLKQLKVVLAAADAYAEQGFTTVQNGLINEVQLKGLSLAARLGLFRQRLVAWPKHELGVAWANGQQNLQDYAHNRLRLGAVKFVVDGSIQGYTGYLTEPYFTPGGHPADYRGYPSISADTLAADFAAVHCAGQQIAAHGNGDAAIDMILSAWEQAQAHCPHDDMRPIIVHAQMARDDQLASMARLGMTPSFFMAHTYYWGDRHRDVFIGPERAARISPAVSAGKAGLRYSTHLDTPVVPITAMLQLWNATTRQTSGGQILGANERLSVEQALRSMTIDAAWQMHLENEIGTLETGKRADLVVVSANPLTYAGDLRDITIQQTTIGGVTVFAR